MKNKIFNNKKIKIRKPTRKDLKDVKKFMIFVNSLVDEGAKILKNKKVSLKEEKEWLEKLLKNIKKKKKVFLMAEVDNIIVGIVSIVLSQGCKEHVGEFGILIKKDYRGIGLGKYLMKEIIKLAKKELKPSPKIIRLSVHLTNKIAINLYKKYDFKKVAVIPKQIKHGDKLINEIIMLLYL